MFVSYSVLLFATQVLSQSVPNGYPENAICALTNAVRFNPDGYARAYNSRRSCSGSSQALGPVYLSDDLNKAAQMHSNDMAANNYFGHDSQTSLCTRNRLCNFSERINHFLKGSRMSAENIAAGETYSNPVRLVNSWLESEGHCNNLLTNGFDTLGVAIAYGNDAFKLKATQTFASIGNRQNTPIVCGGHVPNQNGRVNFFVSAYDTNGRIRRMYVNYNGRDYEMDRTVSGGSGSLYEVSVPKNSGPRNGCGEYYFRAIDGSNDVDRYPLGSSSISANGVDGCSVAGKVQGSFASDSKRAPASPSPSPQSSSSATPAAAKQQNVRVMGSANQPAPVAPKKTVPSPTPKSAAKVASPVEASAPVRSISSPAPKGKNNGDFIVVQSPKEGIPSSASQATRPTTSVKSTPTPSSTTAPTSTSCDITFPTAVTFEGPNKNAENVSDNTTNNSPAENDTSYGITSTSNESTVLYSVFTPLVVVSLIVFVVGTILIKKNDGKASASNDVEASPSSPTEGDNSASEDEQASGQMSPQFWNSSDYLGKFATEELASPQSPTPLLFKDGPVFFKEECAL